MHPKCIDMVYQAHEVTQEKSTFRNKMNLWLMLNLCSICLPAGLTSGVPTPLNCILIYLDVPMSVIYVCLPAGPSNNRELNP